MLSFFIYKIKLKVDWVDLKITNPNNMAFLLSLTIVVMVPILIACGLYCFLVILCDKVVEAADIWGWRGGGQDTYRWHTWL